MRQYCKDCKYIQYSELGDIIDRCEPAIGSGVLLFYSPKLVLQVKSFEPSVQNKYNNCTYYKRKWWKLWIK